MNKPPSLPPPSPPASDLRLRFHADPLAVRAALQQMIDGLGSHNLSPDELGTVELVLAEALNNIVKHAYAARCCGRDDLIELRIKAQSGGVICDISDQGVPMPGGRLPRGKTARADATVDTLPEGGFGWFLIHALAKDLTYRRDGPHNRLHFRLARAARARVS